MDPEIYQRVLAIVSEAYQVGTEQLSPATRWIEDLHDSLEFVEVLMECEDQFKIQIPDEDSIKCPTVGDLATYLTKRLGN